MKKTLFVIVSLIVVVGLAIASLVIDSLFVVHFGTLAFIITKNIVGWILIYAIVLVFCKYKVFFIERKYCKNN